MRTWSEFLPNVTPLLPGCPEPLIEDKLRDAAIVLMRRTRVWRVSEVALGITVAGQRNYTIVPPTDALLAHIIVARAGTEPMEVALPGQTDGVDITIQREPRCCLIEALDGTTIRLTPAPSIADVVMTGTASWKPAETAPGIEDALYADDRVHEAIRAHATGTLMLDADKPWSDDPRAGAMLARFEALVSELAHSVGPVRRNKPLRTRMWG